jgi:hypothetical protein
MYKCGFVPSEYVVEAVYQSNLKRHNSAKRNYRRMVYEEVENDKELQFGEMLDDEIEKLRGMK